MKRVFKWALVAFGVLIAGAIATAAVAKYNSLQEEYGWFVKGLNQLQGVKLGDSQQELQYAYGTPNMASWPVNYPGAPKDAESKFYMPGLDEKPEDFPEWSWTMDNVTVTAQFDSVTKTASEIRCIYTGNDKHVACNTVGTNLAIPDYRTESYIKCRLGKPDREEYDNVNVGGNDIKRKTLFYDKLGLLYVLMGREAVSVTKWKTETPGFLWWLQQYEDGSNC